MADDRHLAGQGPAVDDTDLRAAVLAALGAGEVTDAGQARHTVDAVLARYDEPHRRHHGRRHLREMLAEVDRLGVRRPEVVLALAWHDAVYDPTRPDNEERSASLAAEDLSVLGVAAGTVDEVVRLVGLTADHRAEPGDGPGAALVDADLWILAASAPRYDRYVVDVRAEYAHVGDDDWRRGRGRVLADLDGRLADVGYLVGPAGDRARRTRAARANLARERRALHAPG